MPDQRLALETSLFHQYSGELLRFLTAKLGCREQASDVVQDTFLRVRGVKDLAAVVQPRAFLYKTALNLTIDLFRRQRIRDERTTQLDATEDVPSAAPRQDDTVEAKERVHLLYDAITELPSEMSSSVSPSQVYASSPCGDCRPARHIEKYGGKTRHESHGALPSAG